MVRTIDAHGTRGVDGRRSVWIAGERAAQAWYRAAGYTVVATNWRCPLGELDLVVVRGTMLIVCEVKARRGSGSGPGAGPFEAVTSAKQARVRRLAEAFLMANRTLEHMVRDVRFDVASVGVDPGGRTAVHVFEDAF
jgi:putative endonuclease